MVKKFVAIGIGSFLLAVLVLAPSGCGPTGKDKDNAPRPSGKDNVPGDFSSKEFKLDVNYKFVVKARLTTDIFEPSPEWLDFEITVHGKIKNVDDKLFLILQEPDGKRRQISELKKEDLFVSGTYHTSTFAKIQPGIPGIYRFILQDFKTEKVLATKEVSVKNDAVQVDPAKFKEAFSKSVGKRAKAMKGQIASLWEKSKGQEDEDKAWMEKVLAELEKEQDHLEKQIKELEDAGQDRFESIQQELSKTLVKVEMRTEHAERLSAMLARGKKDK